MVGGADLVTPPSFPLAKAARASAVTATPDRRFRYVTEGIGSDVLDFPAAIAWRYGLPSVRRSARAPRLEPLWWVNEPLVVRGVAHTWDSRGGTDRRWDLSPRLVPTPERHHLTNLLPSSLAASNTQSTSRRGISDAGMPEATLSPGSRLIDTARPQVDRSSSVPTLKPARSAAAASVAGPET